MKEWIKRVLRFYWHHSQAYTLITLPLNGIGALSSILVLFTVVSGVKLPTVVYIWLFLLSTVILFFIGVIVKKLGLLKYWQSLTNSQNEELLSILRKLDIK